MYQFMEGTMKAAILFFFLFHLLCFPTFSATYTCQISELYSVDKDGRLQNIYQNVDKSLDSYDKKFFVDKTTGSTIGNKLENSKASSVSVITETSSSRVFKVISVFDSGTLQLFQVFVHYEGDIKPFSLIENNTFRYGTCQ